MLEKNKPEFWFIERKNKPEFWFIKRNQFWNAASLFWLGFTFLLLNPCLAVAIHYGRVTADEQQMVEFFGGVDAVVESLIGRCSRHFVQSNLGRQIVNVIMSTGRRS
jgi:hypothetical protein